MLSKRRRVPRLRPVFLAGASVGLEYPDQVEDEDTQGVSGGAARFAQTGDASDAKPRRSSAQAFSW